MPEYQVPRSGDLLKVEHTCWANDPQHAAVVHVVQLPIVKVTAHAGHHFGVSATRCDGEIYHVTLDAKHGVTVSGAAYAVAPAHVGATR